MTLKKHLKIAAMVIVALLIAGLLIMHIWNMVIFRTFSLPSLTYIQASGLFLLFNLLFSPLTVLFHRRIMRH